METQIIDLLKTSLTQICNVYYYKISMQLLSDIILPLGIALIIYIILRGVLEIVKATEEE